MLSGMYHIKYSTSTELRLTHADFFISPNSMSGVRTTTRAMRCQRCDAHARGAGDIPRPGSASAPPLHSPSLRSDCSADRSGAAVSHSPRIKSVHVYGMRLCFIEISNIFVTVSCDASVKIVNENSYGVLQSSTSDC